MASHAQGSFPIARQPSIYSLTLDEYQNFLGEPGKSFGSMIMEEFVRNIWTAEESQAMAAAIGGVDDGVLGRQQSVQRQGFLCLPRTLSRKTVDEVWKDIYMGTMEAAGSGGACGRQVTFGEITLDDFLVKAGVGGLESTAGGDFSSRTALSNLGNASSAQTGLEPMHLGLLKHTPQQIEWISDHQYRTAIAHQQHQHNILQQHVVAAKRAGNGPGRVGVLGGGGLAGAELQVGSEDSGLGAGMSPNSFGFNTESPSSPLSEGVNLSPFPYRVDGTIRGRKRCLEPTLEKVVERRQKRMIKNRESAARSRARKQAYTMELEAEVLQLKEENTSLRRLEEEMAGRRRKQILDLMGCFVYHLAPKAQMLRRTCTGPW